MAFEKEITTSTDDDLGTSAEAMTESCETKTNKSMFEPCDYYNGAYFSHYCWSQSINEIGILRACDYNGSMVRQ